MTIEDLKEFNLESYLTEDDWNRFKNFTHDEFKSELTSWFWFYWSMVLIRENVLELRDRGLISEEVTTRIFGDNMEIFIEKFPNMFPYKNIN